ncbi:hypothetical protein MMC27_005883 [Xylographa pallens]|nr:hypothetical protein [Xylographa pallens]
MSTIARLICYTKDPSNVLNQAIWGGLECLTAANVVVAPTLCSLFSTKADKKHDEEAKTESRAMENDSAENIINSTPSTSAISTSNNILTRYRPGTTAWKMSRGQLRRARNPERLSSSRVKSIRMSNMLRPRAPSANLNDAFDLPRGLGNHATCWANSGHFAPEGTFGIVRTLEVHVTREAWTDDDGSPIQTAQSGSSSVHTRKNEKAACGTRSYGDYFGSSAW